MSPRAAASTFTHDGPGTPEGQWQRWTGLAALPRTVPAPSPLVLAAHPDDETLGAGGLVAVCAAARTPARVVVATCGEASHPRSTTTTPAELSRVRRREVRHAVEDLLGGQPVVLLDLPDGGLRSQGATLDAALLHAASTAAAPPEAVVAPWRGDDHPDHEAAGEAGARLAAALGVPLWEYPVWAWHWAAPDDPRVPWGRAVRLELDARARAAKQAALAAHTSQVRPLSPHAGDEAVLPPGVLAHFARPFEVFLVTPAEEPPR